MSSVWARRLSAMGLGALCAASISWALRTPAVAGANASATEFSAERAMRHVRAIAKGPHPTGSPAHLEVLAYLQSELRALGLTPHVQDVIGIGTRFAVAGRVRNVLVRLPGSSPGGRAVLLMSHYDGVPAGPAAGDAAAGTAALLETLRALRAGPALVNDVIALFSDSEETGLLGAAAFAKEHPWARDAAVVLNFEARGVNGPSLMFETGAGNLDVARVLRGVPGARGTSLSTAVYRRLPNDTDLSEMAVLGLPAMNFAFIGGEDRYHTTEDDVAHLSMGSVQHHGVQALALARAFGNGALPRPATPDAVFFFAPFFGLVVYPESWAIPIALLAIVLVFVPIMRRPAGEPLRVRPVVFGAIEAVSAVLVAVFVGYGIGAGLTSFHVSLGSGAPRWSGWYAAAIALFVVAIVQFMSAAARRWLGSTSYAGTLLAWALVSLAVAYAIPGASFLFTWPVLLAALAWAVHAMSRSAGHAVVPVAVAGVVVVIVPTAWLMVGVALGLDAVGGVVLAVLAGMASALLSPLLTFIEGKNQWRGPASTAATAAAVLCVGLVTVRTSVERPTTGVLAYVTDADSGGAWLTGYASNGAGDWLASSLRAARIDSAMRVPMPVAIRRLTRGPAVSVRPTPTARRAPSVTVLKDTVVERGRLVVLRIKPSADTWSIGLQMDTGTVIDATVNGKTVDRSRYRRTQARWALEFVAPPDTGFVLALTTPAFSTAVLGISARASGLPPLPGVTLPPRPAGVLAIQSGDIAVTYRRVRF
jgi:hypothetical protein